MKERNILCENKKEKAVYRRKHRFDVLGLKEPIAVGLPKVLKIEGEEIRATVWSCLRQQTKAMYNRMKSVNDKISCCQMIRADLQYWGVLVLLEVKGKKISVNQKWFEKVGQTKKAKSEEEAILKMIEAM